MINLMKTNTQELADDIRQHLRTGEAIDTALETDERVLARISDGIYRQPASALRELVSNAYDADATRVIIQTDAPRFSEMRVRDNGNGMSIDALATIVHQIGGSSKRTSSGATLGVTDNNDATLSPNGRKLIGKIGIGLFSVAQLTRQFQIITKRKDDDFRLIADVILHTYSDEQLDAIDQDEHTFKTGTVKIWSVPATDQDFHGTEIVIKNLIPRIRDEMRSRGMWELVDGEPDENTQPSKPPAYHVGRVDTATGEILKDSAQLPWTEADPPQNRFKKLVDAVLEASNQNRRLNQIFDTYLHTLWTLSLAIPLNYVDKHPFDTVGSDEIEVYQLSNAIRGQATKISLAPTETLRSKLALAAPVRQPEDKFELIVDGVELARPQPYLRMPRTLQALPFPLLFAGKYQPDFSSFLNEQSGGLLKFEAYLMWTHKVVPIDNQGVLVRIHDASGTSFDPTFMNYQVAENTRLKQITAEVFVERGLESALNIDRESFNQAHPHYQVIVKWIHSALRQLINRQKDLQKNYRDKGAIQREEVSLDAVEKLGEQLIERAFNKYGNSSRLAFVKDSKEARSLFVPDDVYVLSLDRDGKGFDSKHQGANVRRDSKVFNEKRKYFMRLLDSYGLLASLTDEEVQSLFSDLTDLLEQEA